MHYCGLNDELYSYMLTEGLAPSRNVVSFQVLQSGVKAAEGIAPAADVKQLVLQARHAVINNPFLQYICFNNELEVSELREAAEDAAVSPA